MKDRIKRRKRLDGSVYRMKGKKKRWGMEGRGSSVGRAVEAPGLDWTRHVVWEKNLRRKLKSKRGK